MSEFYVGQKVVCVDASSGTGVWKDAESPSEGAIYTISEQYLDSKGALIFQLREISRSHSARIEHGPRVGYWAWRFRPLEYKSMSIFRAIAADPTRKLEKA